jgi:hypothetical protein
MSYQTFKKWLEKSACGRFADAWMALPADSRIAVDRVAEPASGGWNPRAIV